MTTGGTAVDNDDLCFLSAAELAPLIRKRTASPVDIVEAHLERIEGLNDGLRAYRAASPAGGIDARWVMDFARLTGLSLVAESDAKPIAASIAPARAVLAGARAYGAAGVEPPVRSAPA